jgi:hypothetical protein
MATVLAACAGSGSGSDPSPSAAPPEGTEAVVSDDPTETATAAPTDDAVAGASEVPTASATESAILLTETFDSGPGAFSTGKKERAEVDVSDGKLRLYSEAERAVSTASLAAPADGITLSADLSVGPARESLDAGTQDIVGFVCIAGGSAYFLFADNAGGIYFTKLDGPKFKSVGGDYKQKFKLPQGAQIALTAACIHDGATTTLSLLADGRELGTAIDSKSPLGPFDTVGVTAMQDENDGDTAFVTYFFDNVVVARVD